MNIGVLIVFLATALAGIITVHTIRSAGRWIKYLLSFSGAYIFGITIVHLLPETYQSEQVRYVPLYILGGFFLQIILEYFSQGVEHGHVHLQKENPFPFMLFLALFVHAFLEGNLLDDHNHYSNQDLWSYVVGLSVHKIPVAIVLGIILKTHFKTSRSLLMIILFSLATPLGTWVSSHMIDTGTVIMVNGIVAGSFLHISTTILFEATPDHKFDFPKFLLAIIGALASLLLL